LSIQPDDGSLRDRAQNSPKKAKLKFKEHGSSPISSEHGEEDEGQDEPTPERTSPSPPPDFPSTLPALPSFPRPTRPAPPSKAILALQGLDRAIIDAQIVDPASNAPIPRPGSLDSNGLGLDDQMLERLAELGIESLFAGEQMIGSLNHYYITSVAFGCYSTSCSAPFLAQESGTPLPLRSSTRCVCLCTNRQWQNIGLCCSYHPGNGISLVLRSETKSRKPCL
jgi:hypothetical protein